MILTDVATSDYPEGPPDVLYDGGFWAWKRQIPSITYSDYALSYWLAPFGGGAAVEVAATPEANQFTVAVDGGTATAGRYTWREVLTATGDTGGQVTATGELEVLPNPATSETDPRTPEQIILDAIDNLLAGKFVQDEQSITVRGRSLARMPLPELLEAKAAYEQLVSAQQNKSSLVLIRF